jgi:hypothetical protein
VSLTAVSTGIVGLGAGFVLGWLWERYHRHRRGRRAETAATPPGQPNPASTTSRPNLTLR